MSLESVFKLSLIMNMVDHLTGPMGAVQSSVDGSVSKLQAANSAFGSMVSTGSAMATLGGEITSAVLAPVEATFETRRAIGELASLGVQDLAAIEAAATDFSSTWAGTTKSDFITAAYDIKSGIASLSDEGIADYTRLAGLTATATKATTAEMTSLFATGYGIYKDYYDDMSDLEFGEMFSSGISSAVRLYKTSGSEMSAAISRLGASATNANVPMEEQLAILGQLQATMSGSEAGTKYAGFLRSAARGGEELGLSFLDANNQLKSLPEILDQLQGKFGETIDAAEKMELQKAFGDQQAIQFIDLFYNKTDQLQGGILDVYDALGEGIGVTEEMANKINEVEPAQFEVLQQKIHNVKESIGTALLPTVNDFLGKGAEVIERVGVWIENNQELVAIILKVALAIGGVLTVAGSLVAVFGTVGMIVTKTISGFKMLKSGFLLVKGALSPLIGTVWKFTAALLANPVTWIVIGIIALIAAIYLLWTKCEWFRDGVMAVVNFIKEKVGAAIEFIKGIFSGIANFIGNIFGKIKSTVSGALGNIKTTYEEHGGGIKGVAAVAMEGVKGVFSAGYGFLDNLTGGKLTEIKDKFSERFNSIKSTVSSAMETAKATASEKLASMKAAYELHGGGIKGVAAAAMEGVKGTFTTAYNFIDTLTGGKLSSIKEKFSQGIANMKTAITDKFAEFKESGKKLITTFVDGIKSAFTGAVDAVKGGLQKIRDMLPFSDAKTGPLSSLTLSGQRTMTTYAQGVMLAQDAPAEAMEMGLQRAAATLERAPVQKVEVGSPRKAGANDGEEGSGGKNVIIQKLLLQVDLNKIKDLQQLLALLKEVEDYTNGNGSEDPNGDPDIVPTPA